jgi:hypothetical protein
LGKRKKTEGKDPLLFGLLHWLDKQLLESEELFAHARLLVSENSMCQFMKTEVVQSPLLSWRDDVLVKTKHN